MPIAWNYDGKALWLRGLNYKRNKTSQLPKYNELQECNARNIYKKDGAKEYKESKKVNDKDEVIERQFQMPPKVFQSLFGSKVELSDDSDHETSSTSSEVCIINSRGPYMS